MLDAQIVMMIGVAQMANAICHLPCHFLITCIHCDLLILIFVHLTLKLAFVQGAAKKTYPDKNCNFSETAYARFYELGLTRDSRVIPGLTGVSVLSTSNLGLNWD